MCVVHIIYIYIYIYILYDTVCIYNENVFLYTDLNTCYMGIYSGTLKIT